jgi:hypothetical protein
VFRILAEGRGSGKSIEIPDADQINGLADQINGR